MTAARGSIPGGALVALVGALLLLAGCGGGGSDAEQHATEAKIEEKVQKARLKALLKVRLAEQQRREEHPGQTFAPARFSGAEADRYETDRELCSALSPSEWAASFEIDEDSDPEAIAEEYAKSFSGRFHEPAYEGCLAGLE